MASDAGAERESPKMHRISFNEITKTAVKASIKQARDLDMDLVDAQQARRMLDRMVGYSISPLLWAKVKRGLSAGRVQSVALRIICDREEEINSFIPEEYWSLEGTFRAAGEKKAIQAKFYGTDKKFPIHNKKEMDELLERLKDQEYKVTEVKRGACEKCAASVYNQYPAAGGCENPEFFYTENHAFGAAAI